MSRHRPFKSQLNKNPNREYSKSVVVKTNRKDIAQRQEFGNIPFNEEMLTYETLSGEFREVYGKIDSLSGDFETAVRLVNEKTPVSGAITLDAHDVDALSLGEVFNGFTEWTGVPPDYTVVYNSPSWGLYHVPDMMLVAEVQGTPDDTSVEFLGEQVPTGAVYATRVRLRPTEAQEAAWSAKQNALIFDALPTAKSVNPVTSDGINKALGAYVLKTSVDPDPSCESTNPIQNKALFPTMENWDFTSLMIDNGEVYGLPENAIGDCYGGQLTISFSEYFAMYHPYSFVFPGSLYDASSEVQVTNATVAPIRLNPGQLTNMSYDWMKTHFNIFVIPGYTTPISYEIALQLPEAPYKSVLLRKHINNLNQTGIITENLCAFTGCLVLRPDPGEIMPQTGVGMQMDISYFPDSYNGFYSSEISWIIDVYLSSISAWSVEFQ